MTSSKSRRSRPRVGLDWLASALALVIGCSSPHIVEGKRASAPPVDASIVDAFVPVDAGDPSDNTSADCSLECLKGETCVVRAGAARCECAIGWTRIDDPEGPRCEDVDECLEPRCDADRVCLNREGSYECVCPRNQARDGTGKCVDPGSCVKGQGTSWTLDYKPDGFGWLVVDDGECQHLLDPWNDALPPLRAGATIALEAVPDRTSKLVDWEGCQADGLRCSFVAQQDSAIVVHFQRAHNLAFVTSTLHAGDIGLTAADAICMQRAREGRLHGERFIAVLGTGKLGIERLGSARGWVGPNGQPALDRVDSPSLQWPVSQDERGVQATAQNAGSRMPWFGNEQTSCDSFRTRSPDIRAGVLDSLSVGAWSVGGTRPCNELHPLLCFGTDDDKPLRHYRVEGRRAFVAEEVVLDSLSEETVLSSADHGCQAEACVRGHAADPSLSPDVYGCGEVGRPRFKALISTTKTRAASRFELTGKTWVREDGLPWLVRASDLTDGKTLTGLPVASRRTGPRVVVGFRFTPHDLAASAEDACVGDTDDSTRVGLVANPSHPYLEPEPGDCTTSIICLEE